MKYCFVPMLIEEFNNLFRLGRIRLPNNRWIMGNPRAIPFPEGDDLTDQLLDAMPSFEDTISIIVLQFVSYEAAKVFGGTCSEFSFENAVASYALTQHDRNVLASRLGANSKLADIPILLESTVRSLNERLIEQSARDGGRALGRIYVENDQSPFIDKIDQGVINAVQARQDRMTSPIDKGSFLENIFCYSRSGPIPNFDIGFIHDAGRVLRHYCNSNGMGIEHFGLKEAIAEWEGQMRSAAIAEILNSLIKKGVAEAYDKYAGFQGALVSAVVFLKLCNMIREHGESLTRQRLREVLSGIQDQSSVARGVIWCGAFWGFSQFADEYYACVSAGSPRPRFRTWPIENTDAVDRADNARPTVISQPVGALDKGGAEEERSESQSPQSEAGPINETPQGGEVGAASEKLGDWPVTQIGQAHAAEAVLSAQDPTRPVSEPEGNAIAMEPVSNVEAGMHGCVAHQEEDTLSSSTAPEPDAFTLEAQKEKKRPRRSGRDKTEDAERGKATRRSGRSRKPKNAEATKSEPARDVATENGDLTKSID